MSTESSSRWRRANPEKYTATRDRWSWRMVEKIKAGEPVSHWVMAQVKSRLNGNYKPRTKTKVTMSRADYKAFQATLAYLYNETERLETENDHLKEELVMKQWGDNITISGLDSVSITDEVAEKLGVSPPLPALKLDQIKAECLLSYKPPYTVEEIKSLCPGLYGPTHQ